jgi:hypothetical protein
MNRFELFMKIILLGGIRRSLGDRSIAMETITRDLEGDGANGISAVTNRYIEDG